jgi:TRAP-type C4-dicarboxylate transport system substrate-binding protein
LTQGRVTADIVPFDQAGIRGQDMPRLVQLGTIPFGTILLARMLSVDAELSMADLPGMNQDMQSLRRHIAAFRPYLTKILKERHGVELLAIYVYPAQVTFCAKPFNSLTDLGGRRVRVSNPLMGDLMRAYGATPVTTEFADIVKNIKSGHIECAVTGSMSGNTIGLHEVTSHVDAKALGWGVSVFVANLSAWQSLPAEVKELLRRELPKVEAAVWDESDRETADGLACNTGAPGCTSGRKGRMQQTVAPPADAQRLRELFNQAVLPAWVRSCGEACTHLWNTHMAATVGVRAASP